MTIQTRMFEARYTISEAELRAERPILIKREPWFPWLYVRLTRGRPTNKLRAWIVRHWRYKKVEDLIAKRAQELDDAILEHVLNQVMSGK